MCDKIQIFEVFYYTPVIILNIRDLARKTTNVLPLFFDVIQFFYL